MASKDKLRVALVMLTLAVFLGVVFGWKYQQDRQSSTAAPSPLPVEVAMVESAQWQQSLHTTGSLRAINGVTIANETAGVVEAIEFSSGQTVAAGNILIQLNADTDNAALRTLVAEEKLATQDFKRVSNLINDRAISQADFDAAAAKLETTKARVHEQQARLGKKTIRAPFSGRTGLRMVDKGQFLEVGTAIVEIVTLNPIYVDFTISERDLPTVKVGNSVAVSVAAFPDVSFTGTVEALNASINAKSRTIQVRAQLPNDDNLLQAGMFAEVQVFSGESSEVLTIPRTAIAYNTYGDYVFIVKKEGGRPVVMRRQVETGEARDGQTAVIKGLVGGEQIIATGLVRVRNGQSVKVQPSVEKSVAPEAQR